MREHGRTIDPDPSLPLGKVDICPDFQGPKNFTMCLKMAFYETFGDQKLKENIFVFRQKKSFNYQGIKIASKKIIKVAKLNSF
jgi:hypothetical protein